MLILPFYIASNWLPGHLGWWFLVRCSWISGDAIEHTHMNHVCGPVCLFVYKCKCTSVMLCVYKNIFCTKCTKGLWLARTTIIGLSPHIPSDRASTHTVTPWGPGLWNGQHGGFTLVYTFIRSADDAFLLLIDWLLISLPHEDCFISRLIWYFSDRTHLRFPRIPLYAKLLYVSISPQWL